MTLAALGLGVMLLRLTDSAVSRALSDYASFGTLPPDALRRVDDLLLVPLGSVLVTFTRLSLGRRMLGPFRPILIGLAFYQIGVLLGTAFLITVLAIVIGLRPRLEGRGIPYFGRLSVLLASVVLAEIAVLLLGAAVGSENLMRTAIFPIVVLCLTADGFARVLESRGLRDAVWRGGTTVLVAIVIAVVGSIPAVGRFLFEFPEFVLVEMAIIILISTRMRWGLLEGRWSG